MEKSAFSTAAGPGDSNDFAWEDFQSDATQCIHSSLSRFVRFMKIACFEHKKRALRDK